MSDEDWEEANRIDPVMAVALMLLSTIKVLREDRSYSDTKLIDLIDKCLQRLVDHMKGGDE